MLRQEYADSNVISEKWLAACFTVRAQLHTADKNNGRWFNSLSQNTYIVHVLGGAKVIHLLRINTKIVAKSNIYTTVFGATAVAANKYSSLYGNRFVI
jgi:hypothetical protein